MILKKKIFIFLFLAYLSLLISFYLGEDAIGDALNDYKGNEQIAKKFKENFLFTLLNYDDFGARHSPIFYIVKSRGFGNLSKFFSIEVVQAGVIELILSIYVVVVNTICKWHNHCLG